MVVRVTGPKTRSQELNICAQDLQNPKLEHVFIAHCFGRTCGKQSPSATQRQNTLHNHEIAKVGHFIAWRSCKAHPAFEHTAQLVSERLAVENRERPAWGKGEAM